MCRVYWQPYIWNISLWTKYLLLTTPKEKELFDGSLQTPSVFSNVLFYNINEDTYDIKKAGSKDLITIWLDLVFQAL